MRGKGKNAYKDLGIISRFRSGSHMAFRGLAGSGAVPVDCTEAGRLIQTETSLHSVLWNVTAGTSSVGSSPNTGKRPEENKTSQHKGYQGRSSAFESQPGVGLLTTSAARKTKGKKYINHTFQLPRVNNGSGSLASLLKQFYPEQVTKAKYSRPKQQRRVRGGEQNFVVVTGPLINAVPSN